MNYSEWAAVIFGIGFVWYIFPMLVIFMSFEKEGESRIFGKKDYYYVFHLMDFKPISRKKLLFIMFCPVLNIIIGYGIVIYMAFLFSFIGSAIVIGIIEFVNFLRNK